MNVAYILNTPRAASYKLGRMILPQLEAGDHGAKVLGIFFFDDNVRPSPRRPCRRAPERSGARAGHLADDV